MRALWKRSSRSAARCWHPAATCPEGGISAARAAPRRCFPPRDAPPFARGASAARNANPPPSVRRSEPLTGRAAPLRISAISAAAGLGGRLGFFPPPALGQAEGGGAGPGPAVRRAPRFPSAHRRAPPARPGGSARWRRQPSAERGCPPSRRLHRRAGFGRRRRAPRRRRGGWRSPGGS